MTECTCGALVGENCREWCGEEWCEECGNHIPAAESDMVNEHHRPSCSLYPDNLVG